MKDLTEGPITGHVLRLAAPLAIGMVFQTLYYLVDLFFVARLGDAAIAGVGAAGNLQFAVLALTQVLAIGTMALIAQAVGRKDRDDANLVFHQSLWLAAIGAVTVLVAGYTLTEAYMRELGADAAAAEAGAVYLRWFLPGMGLQFAQVVMGAALRGTGIEKPTMLLQMFTVTLNAVLSPFLIAGWLTGRPLGVLGAGLGSTISIAVGVILMALYFVRAEKYVGVKTRFLRPRFATWRRILKIGVPSGAEFGLMFIYLVVIYWATRGFGAPAQAGFSIGSRVMQAIFLPAMAIAFATAPVAGQNFGAGRFDRVRQTFGASARIGSGIMISLTLLCQWRPQLLIVFFTDEPAVLEAGGEFLRIISWNFVASGLVFTCSSMFQALGNTVPSLVSGGSRLLTFVLPAVWLRNYAGFELRYLWYWSVTSIAFQALFSLWLLRGELRRRLG